MDAQHVAEHAARIARDTRAVRFNRHSVLSHWQGVLFLALAVAGWVAFGIAAGVAATKTAHLYNSNYEYEPVSALNLPCPGVPHVYDAANPASGTTDCVFSGDRGLPTPHYVSEAWVRSFCNARPDCAGYVATVTRPDASNAHPDDASYVKMPANGGAPSYRLLSAEAVASLQLVPLYRRGVNGQVQTTTFVRQ